MCDRYKILICPDFISVADEHNNELYCPVEEGAVDAHCFVLNGTLNLMVKYQRTDYSPEQLVNYKLVEGEWLITNRWRNI